MIMNDRMFPCVGASIGQRSALVVTSIFACLTPHVGAING